MIASSSSTLGLSQIDRYLDFYEVSHSYSWTNAGTTTFTIPIKTDGRGQFIPLSIMAETTAKTGTNTVNISYGVTGGGLGSTAFSPSTTGFGTLGKFANITVVFNTATVSLAGGSSILITWSVGSGVASTCTIKSFIMGVRLNK